MSSKSYNDPYPFLNLMRWVSAFIVTFGHVYLFWINPTAIEDRNVLESSLFFISSLRGAAVIIFFGISGFLIGGGIAVSKEFSIKNYLISRFSRIYPVLIPALVLTVLLDCAGRGIFDNQVYGQHWDSGVFGAHYPDKHRSLPNLFAPILAIPYFVAPYGSNGALWSLAYELLFYIIAPICFCRRALFKASTVPILLFFVLFYLIMGLDSAIYWFYWCFGALLRKIAGYANVKARVLELMPLLAFSLIFLILIDRFLGHTNQVVRLPVFVFIFICFFNPLVTSLDLFPRLSEVLAGFSFSLYVIHMPLMYFFGAIASKYGYLAIGGNLFNQHNLIAIFCLFLLFVCISFLFSTIFEKKLTQFVRRSLVNAQ